MGRQLGGNFSNHVIGLDANDPAAAHIQWRPYSVGDTPITSSVAVGNNRWRHLVITYTSGSHVMYVDGVVVGSSSMTGSISTNTSVPLTIGAWYSDGDGYSTSAIDDVRVYNRILSAQDVALLYALGTAKEGNASIASSGFSLGLSAGLMAHWTLDGSTTNWATNTFSDVSGNGFHATSTSMSTTSSPVTGRIGQALKFAQNNLQALVLAAGPNPGTAWTVSAWVKIDRGVTPGDGYMTVYSSRLGGTGLFIKGTTPNFKINWYDNADFLNASTTITEGVWHHVMVSANGTTMTAYLDGRPDGTVTKTSTFPSSSIGIGDHPACCSEPFEGAIDDVRVYGRALSAQEAYQLAQLGSAKLGAAGLDNSGKTLTLASGLVGHWTLDGSRTSWQANTTQDSSGNSNTGTITSMSTTTSPTQGKVGSALKFVGAGSQYVRVGTSLGLAGATGNFTITGWSYRPALGDHGAFFKLGNSTDGTGGDGVAIGISDGGSFENSGNRITVLYEGARWVNTGVDAKTGWHHFALVVDSSGYPHVYWDGTQVYTDTTGAPAAIGSRGTSMAQIGGYISSVSTDRYFTGNLDDIRVYSRTLSAQEVYQLYKGGK